MSDPSDRLDLFMKSRKSERTRKYTDEIYDYLLDRRHDPETKGFVRSGQLRDDLVPASIPNSSTFFYLLTDMEKFQLIEKCSPQKEKPMKGKPAVYYRIKLSDIIDEKKAQKDLLYNLGITDEDEQEKIISIPLAYEVIPAKKTRKKKAA
jgi:hypothetical protein